MNYKKINNHSLNSRYYIVEKQILYDFLLEMSRYIIKN